MARKLTTQQENYKNARLAGNYPKDSYLIAYPKSLKWNVKEVVREAQRLEEHPIISPLLSEARAKVEKKIVDNLVWTKQDSVRILKGIAEKDDAANRDKIIAVKELNQMYGFNEPVKVDTKLIDSELTINIVKAVKPDIIAIDQT